MHAYHFTEHIPFLYQGGLLSQDTVVMTPAGLQSQNTVMMREPSLRSQNTVAMKPVKRMSVASRWGRHRSKCTLLSLGKFLQFYFPAYIYRTVSNGLLVLIRIQTLFQHSSVSKSKKTNVRNLNASAPLLNTLPFVLL